MGKGMLLAWMATFWKAGDKCLGWTGRQDTQRQVTGRGHPPLPADEQSDKVSPVGVAGQTPCTPVQDPESKLQWSKEVMKLD